jgi:1-acyl-sn-glycerol-3-phosphate acyltransferase
VFGNKNVKAFPEGTPIIFCGNHQSHLDNMVLAAAIKPIRTYLTSITPVKAMLDNWVFTLTRTCGIYPISTENPELSLDYLYASLKYNLGIFLFIQGKRKPRTPFHDYLYLKNEGKTGVGRLILRMNGKVPVIPYYTHGTGEALSEKNMIPKRKTYISLTFGKPIFFDHYFQEDGWKKNQEFFNTARVITDQIMSEIYDIMMETEYSYFQLLERIFRSSLSDIHLSSKVEGILRRLNRKIAGLSIQNLKEL